MSDVGMNQRIELHKLRFEAIRELSRVSPEDYVGDLKRWLRESYELDNGAGLQDPLTVVKHGVGERVVPRTEITNKKRRPPAKRGKQKATVRPNNEVIRAAQDLIGTGISDGTVADRLMEAYGPGLAPSRATVSNWHNKWIAEGVLPPRKGRGALRSAQPEAPETNEPDPHT